MWRYHGPEASAPFLVCLRPFFKEGGFGLLSVSGILQDSFKLHTSGERTGAMDTNDQDGAPQQDVIHQDG